jgi:xanthine dehydrogenase YagS FAD-binding subunit
MPLRGLPKNRAGGDAGWAADVERGWLMRPFTLERPATAAAALQFAPVSDGKYASQYLAGGTNLLDLMKLDVIRPETLVDIGALQEGHGAIVADASGLHLGALVRMAAAADHPVIRRDYPVLSGALSQAASAQLRNMASLAGTVLQRTRCNYFRDPSWRQCNKRTPGSGCAAIPGVNRRMAVLGVSDQCIAQYPGDFAVGLVALGAEVELLGAGNTIRTMPVEDLHRLPGDTPHIETSMAPGELITGFRVPAGAWNARSLYLKVRDRASYDFALASAAVALDLAADGTVRAARIGLGGLVTKPWRARQAEAALVGRRLDETAAQDAAETAFTGAVTHGDNAFKPELGRRTLVRALLDACQMEMPDGR